MAEDPKPAAEPEQPEEPKAEKQDEEIGDFINRHIFEKDSVFFEG